MSRPPRDMITSGRRCPTRDAVALAGSGWPAPPRPGTARVEFCSRRWRKTPLVAVRRGVTPGPSPALLLKSNFARREPPCPLCAASRRSSPPPSPSGPSPAFRRRPTQCPTRCRRCTSRRSPARERQTLRHRRRPVHADRRDPTNRVPAILTTNGFGGSKDDQAGIGKAFASLGYVVLSYSGLGFGGSQCKITLDDPDWDGKSATQLISYLGGASGIAFTDAAHTTAAPVLDVVQHDNKDHAGQADLRPAGRHDRRFVRRRHPVRHGGGRPAAGHDRPAHHLERPHVLARSQQHRANRRRQPAPRRARSSSTGASASPRSVSPTGWRTRRATRPGCTRARTSPTGSARRWSPPARRATSYRTRSPRPGTPRLRASRPR